MPVRPSKNSSNTKPSCLIWDFECFFSCIFKQERHNEHTHSLTHNQSFVYLNQVCVKTASSLQPHTRAHTHTLWSLQQLIGCVDSAEALTAVQRFLQSLNQEDAHLTGLTHTQQQSELSPNNNQLTLNSILGSNLFIYSGFGLFVSLSRSQSWF